jgi:hypothetical protein
MGNIEYAAMLGLVSSSLPKCLGFERNDVGWIQKHWLSHPGM